VKYQMKQDEDTMGYGTDRHRPYAKTET